MLAEILFGVLYTFPRPAAKHARASSSLGVEIAGPFDRGRGGPGGWIILDEPELHFGTKGEGDILVPDLAGSRRQRMPEVARKKTKRAKAVATWNLLGVWRDDARVRAEPFDAIELELGSLWK